MLLPIKGHPMNTNRVMAVKRIIIVIDFSDIVLLKKTQPSVLRTSLAALGDGDTMPILEL
jgi:hypothetical protein